MIEKFAKLQQSFPKKLLRPAKKLSNRGSQYLQA